MSNLIAEIEEGKMVVRDSNNDVYGHIIFESKSVNATIYVDNKEFYVRQESADNKDIVLIYNGLTLFKFKFDYLWGNAEIQAGGKDTGYDIKGKWFKAGTRLTDAADNDLIIVVSKESITPKAEIQILNAEEGTHLMVMATLYYHTYTSASKFRSLLFAVGK